MQRLTNYWMLVIVENEGKFHIEHFLSKERVYVEASEDRLLGFIEGVGYMYPNPPFAPHSGECGPKKYNIQIDDFICGQCGELMDGGIVCGYNFKRENVNEDAANG